jgi:catechol 2,3-dioxygenase-like lactoylglutathione lyase family enzyme
MPGRLDAIGIVSADVARSAAFYRAIGLDVPEPAPDQDHFEITLPNGVRLMWDKEELIRRIDPAWQPPGGGHRVALAFECDSPADVDETFARALAAGGTASLEPWDAFWGYRYAQLHDPDGQAVDLFAAL